jgi:molybdate transport system substrate-binding protein
VRPLSTCAPLALLVLAIQGAPARAGEAALTVFAAASLTEPFTAIQRLFETREGSANVNFNFAGSQQLAMQIEQGAAADVFAAADEQSMESLRMRGLLRDAPRDFAHNQVVVILPAANPGRVERLQDLARPGVKVVIAAEGVPAGRYSRGVIEHLAAAPGFEADYATGVRRNVVSEEDNVKGVVAKVQLGEADAGFVYRSDVTNALASKVRVLDVPEKYNVVASYPIAVLKAAPHPLLAQQFVELVVSDEGQRILREHQFMPLTAP